MTRTMTPGMLTAIAAETGQFCTLAEFDFSGGSIYLATASQNITWNGQQWTAVGGALGFRAFQESSDLSSPGVEFTFSGVDQSIIAILLSETYIGRTAKLWLCHFDTSGQVISDPLLLFSGFMNGGWGVTEDRPTQGGGTVTITGRCTDRLAELDQRHGIQTNVGSHQIWFPGDTFFAGVGALQGQPLVWKAGQ